MKNWIVSCESLMNGGKGARFHVQNERGTTYPAFAIRFDNQLFAYINRCGHITVELDHQPGEFFSDDGQTLMCATHGAEYAPDTGACLSGPCSGIGLEPLAIEEHDGELVLIEPGFSVVAHAA